VGHPISVRLDSDVQTALEDAAKKRGVGLSTYLRELAETEARRLRRERIRAQSRAVGAYVASSPEARSFYEDWGTPAAEDEAK
jgi:GNAT superfamily N-acetyltransferase